MDKREKSTSNFDELNDRLIAEKPKGPFIGVRTNLDEQNPEKYNPYNKENHSFFER